MVILMRGKKIDNEFVSEFIATCIKNGINTTDDIVKTAQTNISKIDEAIKAIEKKKIERSKLLDVITTFQQKMPKTSEAHVLPFFNLQYPQTCQLICQQLKKNPVDINKFSESSDMTVIIFCIKQLIECKVVAKSGPYIIRGSSFEDYTKFVLKETV